MYPLHTFNTSKLIQATHPSHTIHPLHTIRPCIHHDKYCARDDHRNLHTHIERDDCRCIASLHATVTTPCAHIASDESQMLFTCAYDRHRNLRTHWKQWFVDASQMCVQTSSHHARILKRANRRCMANARATVIGNCMNSESDRLPKHRNCACDRERRTQAHFERRIADLSQVRVQPSLPNCSHCERSNADASQECMWRVSQRARILEAVTGWCIANARANHCNLWA